LSNVEKIEEAIRLYYGFEVLLEELAEEEKTINHRYSLRIAKLEAKLTLNSTSQKHWEAMLNSHMDRLWLEMQEPDNTPLSKKEYAVFLKCFLSWTSPCIVKINDLEKEHRHMTKELEQVKGLMLVNRELDRRIETARKVESLQEDRLPEDTLLACVKRPVLKMYAAGVPDSIFSSATLQPAQKVQPTRHVRRIRRGQPGPRSQLSQCTQLEDSTQSDKPEEIAYYAQAASHTRPAQLRPSLKSFRPFQPLQPKNTMAKITEQKTTV